VYTDVLIVGIVAAILLLFKILLPKEKNVFDP
jgi:hypothetical protein